MGLGADFLLREPVAATGATGRRGCSRKGAASRRGTCRGPHCGEARDRVFSVQTQPAREEGAAHAFTLRVHANVSTPRPHVLSTPSRPRSVSACAESRPPWKGGAGGPGWALSEAFTYQQGGAATAEVRAGWKAGWGSARPTPPWAGVLPRVPTGLRNLRLPACGPGTRPAAKPWKSCLNLLCSPVSPLSRSDSCRMTMKFK